MEKKSSEEWLKEYPHTEVLDPGGWDRANFEASWNEEITREEFEKRLMVSTLRWTDL